MTGQAITGLVTPGEKGLLYVLKDRDDAQSQAVYLQEDGRLFRITRDARNDWTVTGAEL